MDFSTLYSKLILLDVIVKIPLSKICFTLLNLQSQIGSIDNHETKMMENQLIETVDNRSEHFVYFFKFLFENEVFNSFRKAIV
jgi:hypothetical protein